MEITLTAHCTLCVQEIGIGPFPEQEALETKARIENPTRGNVHFLVCETCLRMLWGEYFETARKNWAFPIPQRT